MKLPFNFGSKFFYRAFLPGTILSLAIARIVLTLLGIFGVEVSVSYVLAGQTFLIGWLFVSLDMPIYMVFEGRRFWPSFLFKFFVQCEINRLARIHKTLQKYNIDNQPSGSREAALIDASRKYAEATVELSNFPLDSETGIPVAIWPTRLGNLIAAYEQYPSLKYGLDSVFFWPRIWLSIDQHTRNELDGHQAQVDGSIYAVAALVMSAGLFLLYALMSKFSPGTLYYLMPPIWEAAAGVACIALAYFVYRTSLHAHAVFGSHFCAAFDQNRSKVKYDDVIALIAERAKYPDLAEQDLRVTNHATWRFLKWHRVRMKGASKNERF